MYSDIIVKKFVFLMVTINTVQGMKKNSFEHANLKVVTV